MITCEICIVSNTTLKVSEWPKLKHIYVKQLRSKRLWLNVSCVTKLHKELVFQRPVFYIPIVYHCEFMYRVDRTLFGTITKYVNET